MTTLAADLAAPSALDRPPDRRFFASGTVEIMASEGLELVPRPICCLRD